MTDANPDAGREALNHVLALAALAATFTTLNPAAQFGLPVPQYVAGQLAQIDAARAWIAGLEAEVERLRALREAAVEWKARHEFLIQPCDCSICAAVRALGDAKGET